MNNYLTRYHTRHLDLMDVLAMYQPRASAARRDGAAVRFSGQARHGRRRGRGGGRARRVAEVRDYCETDVLNTYLVYRFRLMRGELSAGEYAKEIAFVRENSPRRRAALEGVPRGVGGGLALVAGRLVALAAERCKAESPPCAQPRRAPQRGRLR